MSSAVILTGNVQVLPKLTGPQCLSGGICLDTKANYATNQSGVMSINALGSPVAVAAGIPSMALVVLRSLDGASLVALVTSAAGTDQQVPFSDLLVIGSASSPVTGLKLLGVGRVEYLLAGG